MENKTHTRQKNEKGKAETETENANETNQRIDPQKTTTNCLTATVAFTNFVCIVVAVVIVLDVVFAISFLLTQNVYKICMNVTKHLFNISILSYIM